MSSIYGVAHLHDKSVAERVAPLVELAAPVFQGAQDHAQALRVDPGAALLRIERLTWTADGVPLDFEYLYVRGEAFQYALRLPRHP